jgi:hypothetical protein
LPWRSTHWGCESLLPVEADLLFVRSLDCGCDASQSHLHVSASRETHVLGFNITGTCELRW